MLQLPPLTDCLQFTWLLFIPVYIYIYVMCVVVVVVVVGLVLSYICTVCKCDYVVIKNCSFSL